MAKAPNLQFLAKIAHPGTPHPPGAVPSRDDLCAISRYAAEPDVLARLG